MTAEELARVFGARPAGRGRWMALCPVHGDRSPSLSIREGRDVNPLLHCFAGCDTRAVLATRGLTLRDLFAGPPRSLAAMREALKQSEARKAEDARIAQASRKVADLYRRVALVVDASGAALAHVPDTPGSDTLAATFHRACRMQQEMETRLGNHGWASGSPLKLCAWSPFTEPNEEAIEAGRVRTEAQLLRYLATGLAESQPEQAAQRPVSAGLLEECA